jgi:ferrous-iron efflux pump FieF
MSQTLNKQEADLLKKAATTASISVASILCALKLWASLSTGSLAVLSSLIDSLADVFASSISFVAVRFSSRPASCNHRYGYGRAESVSALLQSAFITGSGLFVLYDGIDRLLNPVALQKTNFGILIMFVSLIITLFLIAFQNFVARKTASPAVEADKMHYLVDVLTNASIIVSLVAVRYFHLAWFDMLTAVFISAFLIYNAYKIAADAVANLTDQELSPLIRSKVIDIIRHSEGIKGFHDFRSRDLGGMYHFEIHLELDGQITLEEAHTLTDLVENKIKERFPQAQVIIHQDPYGIAENHLDDQLGQCDLF